MVTESVNPDTTLIDELSTIEQIRLMNAQDADVAAAVGAQAEPIARTVDAVAERMARGGRLLYVGAGTAGRLGVLDASEIPPTFGMDPGRVIGLIAGGERAIQHAVENAEDDTAQGAADLDTVGLTADDAVVGLAASGRTPYVIGALQHARERGAFTAGLSCNPDSKVAAAAEVGIEVVVGPEVITGSTRLKSGTAQKLVLNMISTLTMIKLGKTYGNLMVDVRATNEKLHRRSERLVSIATGVDTTEARTALDACGGSVKTAIAMVVTGSDAAQAQALLDEHGGFLKPAIAAHKGAPT
ncbi:N-acetylmuramic acid 6-phosphate etherase [Propionibacteriaceae bacterium Y1685]